MRRRTFLASLVAAAVLRRLQPAPTASPEAWWDGPHLVMRDPSDASRLLVVAYDTARWKWMPGPEDNPCRFMVCGELSDANRRLIEQRRAERITAAAS